MKDICSRIFWKTATLTSAGVALISGLFTFTLLVGVVGMALGKMGIVSGTMGMALTFLLTTSISCTAFWAFVVRHLWSLHFPKARAATGSLAESGGDPTANPLIKKRRKP